MFPKIIMAILFLVFVPQPGNQNQNPPDCRLIESSLGACRKQLRECERNQGNSDCQAKLQDQKRVLSQQAAARYGQLEADLTAARTKLRTCQSDSVRLKEDLTRAQSDQGKSDSLSNELNGSRRTVADLREQNAQQKKSYEEQLAERQKTIDARTRELDDKNREIVNKNDEIARLNGARDGWAEEARKTGQSLKSPEQAKVAADQAWADLQASLSRLSDEERKKPSLVQGLIKDYQTKLDQNGAPVSITQGKDGSIKRELVIGTLEVTPYPTEIPAEEKLQLIATFTPRPLGDIVINTPWYVNLVYNPPPGIKAVYNQEQSFGEAVREIKIYKGYTWVWLVDAPNSQAALAATQMDILAGFEKDTVDRIAGQPVILTREKPKPGWFASLFATVKENLTYILASIMTLLGIWAAYLNVKLRRVEVEKTKSVEAPQP